MSRDWYPLLPVVHPAAVRNGRRRAPAPRAVNNVPIDPLSGPALALSGRVVTMDARWRVLPRAVVYIRDGGIVAVQPPERAAPPGFEDVRVIATEGTIFPGLIELHNHLSYDALPLWSPVPRKFEHRGQWPDHPDYRRLISGPMTVVGKTPRLLPSLVRYVECKCLLGGVTTSQGIMLNSNAGVQRFYRGIVRNVEKTSEADLPEAEARIPDIDARSASSFFNRMVKAKGKNCCLLHLSEGVTDPAVPQSIARRHFLALEVRPNQWALTDAFAGIHATGLLEQDFRILARRNASIVWSPLSNLLLYGDTTRIAAARAAGVKVAIGSDWSPSGSKNLLGELKVAWLYSQHVLKGRDRLDPADIVAMATSVPAEILKWDRRIGSIEAGKRADLLVIRGTGDNEYVRLLHASETAIRLVMINGVARYGVPELMNRLSPDSQTLRVGGSERRLYLAQPSADPVVAAVSLSAAKSTLTEAFRDLRAIAREVERPRARPHGMRRMGFAADRPKPVVWTLALDETSDTGESMRPRLPFGGPRDFTGPRRVAPRASQPLSQVLNGIALDPLTVVDDRDFLTSIATQPNIPDPIRRGLAALY